MFTVLFQLIYQAKKIILTCPSITIIHPKHFMHSARLHLVTLCLHVPTSALSNCSRAAETDSMRHDRPTRLLPSKSPSDTHETSHSLKSHLRCRIIGPECANYPVTLPLWVGSEDSSLSLGLVHQEILQCVWLVTLKSLQVNHQQMHSGTISSMHSSKCKNHNEIYVESAQFIFI